MNRKKMRKTMERNKSKIRNKSKKSKKIMRRNTLRRNTLRRKRSNRNRSKRRTIKGGSFFNDLKSSLTPKKCSTITSADLRGPPTNPENSGMSYVIQVNGPTETDKPTVYELHLPNAIIVKLVTALCAYIEQGPYMDAKQDIVNRSRRPLMLLVKHLTWTDPASDLAAAATTDGPGLTPETIFSKIESGMLNPTGITIKKSFSECLALEVMIKGIIAGQLDLMDTVEVKARSAHNRIVRARPVGSRANPFKPLVLPKWAPIGVSLHKWDSCDVRVTKIDQLLLWFNNVGDFKETNLMNYIYVVQQMMNSNYKYDGSYYPTVRSDYLIHFTKIIEWIADGLKPDLLHDP